MSIQTEYLGDAVYVEADGNGLILTTTNGYHTTNRIYLEPDVYRALVRFVARLQEKPDAEH